MGDTSGTLQGVTLDGLSLDVKEEADITINHSPFVTEGVPSSGRTMFKMTIRNPNIEGVPLLTSPDEADRLKELAKSLQSFPMAMTLADGSVLRGTGRINYENWTTADNISTIQLIPNRAINGWTTFVNP